MGIVTMLCTRRRNNPIDCSICSPVTVIWPLLGWMCEL
uniref:Uncharacterized protein n=1 Tax=Arundo donax TaxID=35708 RepID=A0A0A8ZV56_ARUDO